MEVDLDNTYDMITMKMMIMMMMMMKIMIMMMMMKKMMMIMMMIIAVNPSVFKIGPPDFAWK